MRKALQNPHYNAVFSPLNFRKPRRCLNRYIVAVEKCVRNTAVNVNAFHHLQRPVPDDFAKALNISNIMINPCLTWIYHLRQEYFSDCVADAHYVELRHLLEILTFQHATAFFDSLAYSQAHYSWQIKITIKIKLKNASDDQCFPTPARFQDIIFQT